MKNRSFMRNFYLLLACFVISRVIVKLCGINFGYNALFEYWQYLDTTSLKTNLLQSLWYQHSQPPVFNLLLGVILKVSGNYSLYVIEYFLMAISFCNALLLLSILRGITTNSNLSLFLSLLYLLSPATILFENELFYTTFISLLLLIAARFIIQFTKQQSWQNISGMFAALILVCLTRSMYHLMWWVFLAGVLFFMYRGRQGLNKIVVTGLISISILGGWYLKNYLVFGNFSASSWVGINFARIVFHDERIIDSNSIASVHPFMPISYYKNFIADDYKKKFAGLNDRVLLFETKNDRYINMNNAGYLEVSKRYMSAGLQAVGRHPASYLKNVLRSFIIFFTPASSYFKVRENDTRIRYYDMIYSLNLSHLFKNDYEKKRSLVLVAIPKFLLYFFIVLATVREGIRWGAFSFLNIFIVTTILFSLVVGSLLDYGENMRFRYEIEPLFLLLVGGFIASRQRKGGYK